MYLHSILLRSRKLKRNVYLIHNVRYKWWERSWTLTTGWNIVTWSEWCLLNEDLDRIDGLYNEIYLNQITSLRNLLSMWKIIDLNCTYKIFFCVCTLDKICIQFWIIESSKFYIIRADYCFGVQFIWIDFIQFS